MTTIKTPTAADIRASVQSIHAGLRHQRELLAQMGRLDGEAEERLSREAAEADVVSEIAQRLLARSVTRSEAERLVETLDRINGAEQLRAMAPTALSN